MSSPPRLTPTSFIVLGLIDAAGEATSYDLKRGVAGSLGNFWSLPHAQLYAEPERLTEAGYLSSRREESGRRRRHYRLTAAGREALRAWVAEPTGELTELRDLALLKVFFGADPKRMAEAQLPEHRRKLSEYEELRERAEEHLTPGMLVSLRAGLRNERLWIEFWSELREGGEG